MSNPSKAKGTDAEMGVVDYLESLDKRAYRPALQGTNDLGDVHYRTAAGRLVVVQVKGGRAAETASPEQVAAWLAETDAQAQRAARNEEVVPIRFLVTKRAGVGRPRAGLWRAHCLSGAARVWSTDLATMVDAHG